MGLERQNFHMAPLREQQINIVRVFSAYPNYIWFAEA